MDIVPGPRRLLEQIALAATGRLARQLEASGGSHILCMSSVCICAHIYIYIYITVCMYHIL